MRNGLTESLVEWHFSSWLVWAENDIILRWRHNDHAGVSNHQPHGCFLNRLFRRKSKKTSKPHVTGLCAGNSPGTGEFPAQMASYAENVSIWWCHHDILNVLPKVWQQWVGLEGRGSWKPMQQCQTWFTWFLWINSVIHESLMKYNFHYALLLTFLSLTSKGISREAALRIIPCDLS